MADENVLEFELKAACRPHPLDRLSRVASLIGTAGILAVGWNSDAPPVVSIATVGAVAVALACCLYLVFSGYRRWEYTPPRMGSDSGGRSRRSLRRVRWRRCRESMDES